MAASTIHFIPITSTVCGCASFSCRTRTVYSSEFFCAKNLKRTRHRTGFVKITCDNEYLPSIVSSKRQKDCTRQRQQRQQDVTLKNVLRLGAVRHSCSRKRRKCGNKLGLTSLNDLLWSNKILVVIYLLAVHYCAVATATCDIQYNLPLSSLDISKRFVEPSTTHKTLAIVRNSRRLVDEIGNSEEAVEKFVLETTTNADNASFGNMFDVQGKNSLSPINESEVSESKSNETSLDIIIYGITGIRVSNISANERIEIYTKPGSYVDYEFDRTAWTLVLNATLETDSSIKSEEWLPVPEFEEPIVIPPGEKRAFFVTLAQETLLYTSAHPLLHPSGTRIETTTSKNSEVEEPLDIFVGIGVNHYPPFIAPATSDISSAYPAITENRIFNGQITYSSGQFGKSKEIGNSMDGGNQNYGVIFDVTAGEKTKGNADFPMILKITAFDFLTNVSNASITVTVLAKNERGSYLLDAAEDSSTKVETLSIENSWHTVCSAEVEGKGPKEFTSVPPEACEDVFVSGGDTQAFLLVLDQKELMYSNFEATEEGELNEENRYEFSSNDDITLWVGHGAEPITGEKEKKSSFKLYPNRSFNGVVHYSVERDEKVTTEIPSAAPTWAPITEEVIIDEATAEPLRSQQIISLEHVTDKDLRRWRRLGEQMAKKMPLDMHDVYPADSAFGNSISIEVRDALQRAKIGGDHSSRYLTDPYEDIIGNERQSNENFMKEDVDNRDQANIRDQYYNPYILLYVENAVQDFLKPYTARNDPPVDISNVHVYEGVPPDAQAFGRKLKRTSRRRQILQATQRGCHLNYTPPLGRGQRSLQEEPDAASDESSQEEKGEINGSKGGEGEVDSEGSKDPEPLAPKDKGVSIDFYTTIDGEYNPPPTVNFDELVETLFDNAGDRFVANLRSSDEEKGMLFEEVADDVQLQRVTFSVPDELLNENPPVRYSKGIISLILTLCCLGSVTIAAIVLTISHKKRENIRRIQKEERRKKMEMQRRERASGYCQGSVVGSVVQGGGSVVQGGGSVVAGVQYHNANGSVIGGGSVLPRGDRGGSVAGGVGSVASSNGRPGPTNTRSLLTMSRLSQQSLMSHQMTRQHSQRTMTSHPMHARTVLSAPPQYSHYPGGSVRGPPMNPMNLPEDGGQIVDHAYNDDDYMDNYNPQEIEDAYDPRMDGRHMHDDGMNAERIPLDRDSYNEQ